MIFLVEFFAVFIYISTLFIQLFIYSSIFFFHFMYSFIHFHFKNHVFNSVLFLFELISTNTFITACSFTFLHAFLCHHASDSEPVIIREKRSLCNLIWITFNGDDILWYYDLGFSWCRPADDHHDEAKVGGLSADFWFHSCWVLNQAFYLMFSIMKHYDKC